MKTLRPYQSEAARAILHSVTNRLGHTFSIEMARQAGKNELSAWLEAVIMTKNVITGGTGIKSAPTFRPQLLNSMDRLKSNLSEVGYVKLYRVSEGFIITLGKARWLFLSAEAGANIVGATASLLLEVDEAQDVSPDKYDKALRPMASTTNTTTVLYGTAWDEFSLLERQKQTNIELERRDGIRRHFEYPWSTVAQFNPDYAAYVAAERDRLGPTHPLFVTQYELKILPGTGRLLTNAHIALLQGQYPRVSSPNQSHHYVAGLDVAGEDLPEKQLLRGRDETVLTIAQTTPASGSDKMPLCEVVQTYAWRGDPHSTLWEILVGLLRDTWRIRHIAVDSTAAGEGAALYLAKALGENRVTPYRFTEESKSHLGFQLQQAANLGRLKLWQDDASPERRELDHQLARCRAVYKPNRRLSWYVDPADGHDDYVSSLALTVEAARTASPPRRAHGRTNEGA